MKLYRFDYLIEQKALSVGTGGMEVRAAFLKKLKMTHTRFYRIRQSTTESYVNLPLRDLVKASQFFGVGIDEIINMPAARKIR